MKVCLVNDTSDDPNWGARATSFALRELIHEAGGRVVSTLYQYRIGIPQREDIVTLNGRGVTEGVYRDVAPYRWADFESRAREVMEGAIFPAIRAALADSDIVLVSGEGCIYDCTRQSRMIYFIAYLAKRFFGKVTALINHSIVLNDPVLEEIARHVYPLLDDIVFREGDSARACPAGQARLAADAAYLYQPETLATWWGSRAHLEERASEYWRVGAFDPQIPYVCIGGGSVYFRGLRTDFDPVPGFVRLSRALRESVGQVLLTASSAKDLSILEPVAEELDLPLAGPTLPIQQAVNLMGNARLYIGARWHPSIFAHRGGTPVIALSRHTPKMDAFLRQADMPPSDLDPFAIENQFDDIIAGVKANLHAGEGHREQLRRGAAQLAEKARENVRLLSEL